MDNNFIEKYELFNGTAIIDSDYNIVTANEELYRFMGLSINASILEVIHQVDADDFIDVCSSLQSDQEKNMVLRMRRNDNSFRWMLVGMKRYTETGATNYNEYLGLQISDIIALKKQNQSLQNSVTDFRHLIAMENELFFTYDFETRIFQINNFIDNEVRNILTFPIEQVRTSFIDKGYISKNCKDKFFDFCKDIEEGKVSFSYQLTANFIQNNQMFADYEFKGSTIYVQMTPRKVVGSIRNLFSSNNSFNIKTYEYDTKNALMSYMDVRSYSEKNIHFDPDCNMTFILMEIDYINDYLAKYGQVFVNDIHDTTIEITRKLLGYRGIICEIRNNLYSIAVKDLNTEGHVRAFIQTLRSEIAWNYQKKDMNINITFSIGIARYPNNGTDLSLIHRKMVRALEIAEERGRGRYIIYREYVHGDME